MDARWPYARAVRTSASNGCALSPIAFGAHSAPGPAEVPLASPPRHRCRPQMLVALRVTTAGSRTTPPIRRLLRRLRHIRLLLRAGDDGLPASRTVGTRFPVVVAVGINGTCAAKSERDNDPTPCCTGRDEDRHAHRFCFGVVEACNDPAVSLNQLPFDHRRIVERERRSRRPGLRPMHAWVRDAGVPTKAAAAAITAPRTAERPASSRQRRSHYGDRHAPPQAATQLHPPRIVAPRSGRSPNTPRAAATAPGDGRSARSDRRRTRPHRALGARVEGRTDSSATPRTAHRARRRHFHKSGRDEAASAAPRPSRGRLFGSSSSYDATGRREVPQNSPGIGADLKGLLGL